LLAATEKICANFLDAEMTPAIRQLVNSHSGVELDTPQSGVKVAIFKPMCEHTSAEAGVRRPILMLRTYWSSPWQV
jgi:hypothetical protein